MIQWVIKYSGGLITEEGEAEYVLWGLIILIIAAAVIVFIVGGESNIPVTDPSFT